MPGADSKVTLAIEASGSNASVAVGWGEALEHLEPVSHAARHDDDLMPAIARAFDRINASPKDLGGVVVSIGPGGFTGLRIAVSTAKTLALALKCHLFAVPEADAVVQVVGAGAPLAVCLSGKHGHFWTAFHERGCLSNGQLISTQDIIERSSRLGIGQIAVSQPQDRLTDLAAAAASAGINLIDVRPDASNVFQAGCRLLAAGQTTSPECLLPLYPREPEAIRLWRQRKG